MTRVWQRLWAARTPLLSVAGFGSLDAALWTGLGTAAGLAGLGAAFLVFEYLNREDQ